MGSHAVERKPTHALNRAPELGAARPGSAVASDDDAIEDAAGDDASMRKAKTPRAPRRRSDHSSVLVDHASSMICATQRAAAHAPRVVSYTYRTARRKSPQPLDTRSTNSKSSQPSLRTPGDTRRERCSLLQRDRDAHAAAPAKRCPSTSTSSSIERGTAND